MEYKTTIIDDDNAIISVDDLILQIGILNVKLLEKDKILQATLKRLQELEKRNAELNAYKNDYDILAKRFNELQEELKRREIEIINLKKEIEVLRNKGKKK